MLRRAAVLVVFAACLALADGARLPGGRAGAAPVPKHLLKPAPVYFPTRVGTKWVYTRGDHDEIHTVTKVERKKGETLVTVEWDKGEPTKPYEVMSVRADGLYLISQTGEPYDPPWHVLRCPVELGKAWESKPKRGRRIVISDKRTVAASEKVRVPAGEFETVRVEGEFAIQPQGVTLRSVHWYAPDVGLVQICRHDSRSDTMDITPHLVLKSFSPGKE